MKKLLFSITFVLIISNVLLAQIGRDEAKERYEKEVIAIYPFVDAASKFTSNGEKITSLVTATIVNMNRFTVVDRENIDKYLKEMELQLAGITDTEVIEAGRIYGYTKAIYGTVTSINTYRDRGYYNEDTGEYTYYTKASVKVTINIVDVETTEIISSIRATGYGEAPTIMLGSRAVALNQAYDDLVISIASKLKNVFKVRVKIYDRQNQSVTLLTGKEHGINKGTRFKVYQESAPIKLQNGEIIEKRYEYKGSLKVTTTGEEYSIAKITRGPQIQAGDIAEEYIIGNVIFSVFGSFGTYEMPESKASIDFTDRYGDIFTFNQNTERIDYSFVLAMKIGYDIGMFSPYLLTGLDLAVLEHNHTTADVRLGVDIIVPIYYEVFSFVVSPYFGMKFVDAEIGELVDKSWLQNTYKGYLEQLSLGFGILGGFKYSFNDRFSMTLMGGYKYFFSPASSEISFDDEKDVDIRNVDLGVPDIGFTGFEASLSFDILF